MLKFDTIEKLIYNIKDTNKTFKLISNELNIGVNTISSINKGIIYRQKDLVYPLRQKKKDINTKIKTNKDNLKHYSVRLKELGYSIKQIHIIIGQLSYTTISRYIEIGNSELYIEDKALEERKLIFDLISEPNSELINQTMNTLTLEDLIYIKFLSRMGKCKLTDVVKIFLPLMEFESIVWKYKLETEEDLHKYIDWCGTKSKLIYLIKLAFTNKIYRIKGVPFYYNDLGSQFFLAAHPSINPSIVDDMIGFETKEEHIKRIKGENSAKETN